MRPPRLLLSLSLPVLLAPAAGCGGPGRPAAGTPAGATDPQPRNIDMPPEPVTGQPRYPSARRDDVVDELHGQKVADPYRWLEDLNDPEVKKWLAAQDELARATLAGLPGRDALAARFKELFYLDAVSAPYRRGDRYFYSRRHKDKEKSIVYWRQGKDGEEKVLLDPHTFSADGTAALGGWYPSWDGQLVAYTIKQNNADESVMYVRTVATGEDSKIDVIEGLRYSGASWTPDASGFYYTHTPNDPSIPAHERTGKATVRFHRLGTDPKQDEVVFPETGDPQAFTGASVTRDGRYLWLYASFGPSKNDIYFKDLTRKSKPKAAPAAPAAGAEPATTRERVAATAASLGFVPFAAGKDAIYGAEYWKDRAYVLTNEDAPTYRVFKVDMRRPQRERWKEIIPAGKDPIDNIQVVGGHLVVSYLRNATSDMEIRTLDGKLVRKVELPALGTSGGMAGLPEDDTAYFGFSTFTEPTQIYETSIKTGKSKLYFKVDLPVDTSQMTANQVWYESKDGTRVSMFVVHRKDLALDGSAPALLTGYGGFNISNTPYFSTLAVTWLEHGGVYAIPNLRGGGEYGEDWHRAGMLLNKQNVFDDFIAAAEYLIREGYTRPERLAIWGGSNGGLLVGAVMTQRPELYRAVVCAAPLLDMVRYHKFGLGQAWVPEYGSADDPEQFAALYAYSPYHRVRQGTKYPALLMMSPENDDRVDPLHARKFTAAVQWAQAGDAPVLMRVERNAGHGGADLIKQSVEQYADMFAFLFWQLGIE